MDGSQTNVNVVVNVVVCVVMTMLQLSPVIDGSKCNPPKIIADATYQYKGIRLPDSRFNPGATVTFTCDPGLKKGLDSEESGTCIDGRWQGLKNFRCCLIEICIDPNLHCTLPRVPNTELEIIAGNESFALSKDKMGYGLGTSIRYECIENQIMVNGSTNGPFKCIYGGEWSPSNFTKCVQKGCPAPPKIANGNVKYQISGDNYYVGSTVEYECDSGFDMSILKYASCDSKQQWKPSFGPMFTSFYNEFGFPKCTKKFVPYKPTYDSGSSYVSGSSGNSYDSGSGSSSSSNDYSYNTKSTKSSSWSAGKTIFVMLVIFFVLGLCACAMTANSGNSSRTRAVVVDGVTTTQYVGPNTYGGPVPSLTTGPPAFNPNGPTTNPRMPNYLPTSIPQQQPMDVIPLAPQTTHLPYTNQFSDAPPNYEEAMRKSTAPSAPLL